VKQWQARLEYISRGGHYEQAFALPDQAISCYHLRHRFNCVDFRKELTMANKEQKGKNKEKKKKKKEKPKAPKK